MISLEGFKKQHGPFFLIPQPKKNTAGVLVVQNLLPFADEVPAQRSETGAPQKLHLVKQKLGTTNDQS